MKSGPTISSSLGRLIAWTWPQKWPSPLPRSRNQRPPGNGSMRIGRGFPSGVSFDGPICSRSASKVASSEARTLISCVRCSVRLSREVAVNVTGSLLSFRLGALLHPRQLMTPEALEESGPLVDRPQRRHVRAVVDLPAIAPRLDQPNVPEHLEVLRDRGLAEPELVHDVGDRSLARREEHENVAAASLGHRVEDVRAGCRARHETNIFPLRNMSSSGNLSRDAHGDRLDGVAAFDGLRPSAPVAGAASDLVRARRR